MYYTPAAATTASVPLLELGAVLDSMLLANVV
jgi:hypothetical protein